MRRRARAYYHTLTAGVLTGFIAGIAVTGCLLSSRVDSYHAKIRQLENVIEDKDSRLNKLEESINEISRKKYLLKDVEVYPVYEGNELDRIEFEKHIEEKYRHLIGQEVTNIDIELAAAVIDKRIFILDRRQYRLKVEKILLAEIMKIWTSVTEIEE